MKGLIKYGLAAAMVFATAMPAMARMARSFDICAGGTDLATQDDLTKAGASFTVAANIFPKGTIPMGGVKLCSDIATPVIGTFYANVSLQAGLGSPKGLPAAPDVQGFVTWQFDFSPKGGLLQRSESSRYLREWARPTSRRSWAQAANFPVTDRLP